MGEDMDLEDFDTEGMTKEELELWSLCAPKDQKLVEDSKIKKSSAQQFTRTWGPSGTFSDTLRTYRVTPLMCF